VSKWSSSRKEEIEFEALLAATWPLFDPQRHLLSRPQSDSVFHFDHQVLGLPVACLHIRITNNLLGQYSSSCAVGAFAKDRLPTPRLSSASSSTHDLTRFSLLVESAIDILSCVCHPLDA
jgi:hypothetical protein